MGKKKRRAWLFKSIVLHDALLNAVIIATACFYDPILFWILIITLPLLAVAIHNVRQSNQKLSNVHGGSLKTIEMQTNFNALLKSSNASKVKETDLNLIIGNEQSSQPYNTCIINIESSCTNKKIKSNKPQEQEFGYSKSSFLILSVDRTTALIKLLSSFANVVLPTPGRPQIIMINVKESQIFLY